MNPEYTPGEPDTWTWPDAYDVDDPPEPCPHCGGTGWQDCGDVSIECPECVDGRID